MSFIPPTAPILAFDQLTKKYGSVTAVAGLSAEVLPGRVTGFLGPNGAGKTTILRMLLGLTKPTSGRATVGGVGYSSLRRPAQTVGSALEMARFASGRSARNHLRVLAPASRANDSKVDDLLRLVELGDVKRMKVGGFSLGMRQRLSLAACLLGDPSVLVLDEPTNGLDPAGIAWLRTLLRGFAAEGKTVLISSHLLAEVEQTVDDVLVISQGHLVHAGSLPTLAALSSERVQLKIPAIDRIRAEAMLTDQQNASWRPTDDGTAQIVTLTAPDFVATRSRLMAAGVPILGETRRIASLEEAFLEAVKPAASTEGPRS